MKKKGMAKNKLPARYADRAAEILQEMSKDVNSLKETYVAAGKGSAKKDAPVRLSLDGYILEGVKRFETQTGSPVQITAMWPDKNGAMQKRVYGALAERKGLTVKFPATYMAWNTRKNITIPKAWRRLEDISFDSIDAIRATIEGLIVEDMKRNGTGIRSDPTDGSKLIYKCPKCGAWGGPDPEMPPSKDGFACTGYNRLFPVSIGTCCQYCGDHSSSLDYGPMAALEVFGSDDHGYSVAIDGPNFGSGGGPTYIPVGRIIFPKL
jgi:hypothetical protein